MSKSIVFEKCLSAYDLTEDREKAAAERGQIVIYPGPCDVFVDIDDVVRMQQFELAYQALRRNGVDLVLGGSVPSKSGGAHRHLYLRTAEPLNDTARVALQAVLGSDPVREAIALVRIAKFPGYQPTSFFEAPGFDIEALFAPAKSMGAIDPDDIF